MFVQVIQGPVHDPAGLRRLMDRWVEELGPTAPGWLGGTGGVTEEGESITVVRFASEGEARANSQRPEQGAWWEEVAKHFDRAPVFRDCTDVEVLRGGGSDEAGFVQVIQSEFDDLAAVREATDRLNAFDNADFSRPDLIGLLLAWHPDGRGCTEVAYFTNEQEARRGEAQEAPAELQRAFEDWRALCTDIRYLDLRDPWLVSPAA